MAVQQLFQAQLHVDNGGKINALIQLHQLGVRVPEGVLIDATALNVLWRDLLPEIDNCLSIEHLALEYKEVLARFKDFVLPEEWRKQLEESLEPGQAYIVRSSSLMEDRKETSFAGQFESFLDCHIVDEIVAAIGRCIASMFQPEALAYCRRIQLPLSQLRMAVLIQKQVEPDVSGVIFSLNPLTNDDQMMYLEYVAGHAEQLMDGKLNPNNLTISWYGAIKHPAPLLAIKQLDTLRQAVLRAVTYFGYPLDLEFYFVKDILYLVQARPITTIPAKVEKGSWTTANFRDGGVAAQACPNFMWSLYRGSWQSALTEFLTEHRLVPTERIGSLALLRYARPFWNIGIVKEAMSQIPGYIEREFDDELGVRKNYQGDGVLTRLSLSSLLHVAGVAIRLGQTTRSHQSTAEQTKHLLLTQYHLLNQQLEKLKKVHSLEEVEALWRYLVNEAYMESETTYFKQVFINTVQLSMKKTALLRHLPKEIFFKVISNLGNVSHLKPLEAILEIAEAIRKNPTSIHQWNEFTIEQLQHLMKDASRLDAQQVDSFKRAYGYHSSRELTLLHPSFSEDPESIIALIQKVIQRPEFETSIRRTLDSTLTHHEIDAMIKPYVSQRKARKIKRDVLFLRELLWWREEFKDISTRYYHLLRQVTLLLGKHYREIDFIKDAEDLFYLEKETIIDFMDQPLNQNDLQKLADDNRSYCQAYRLYEPAGELFEELKNLDFMPTDIKHTLSGIGANIGTATGKVRVLSDLSEMASIQPGEILVTRFTDTGWSYAFGIIGGLITETGGVLSHATIVAREFGIPAIVCANEATQHLTTGMQVTMNGYTGAIVIHD